VSPLPFVLPLRVLPLRTSWAYALLFVACIAAWALFPATGLAAPEGDATIMIDPFIVQSGQSGYGQAFCPPGSRVVGGGVTQSGGEAGASFVRISGPLDETPTSNSQDGDVGRSWFAVVYYGGGGTATFVSTAICSQGSDATFRVDPFTVTSPGSGDGQAFCPPGSRVVGGGVTEYSEYALGSRVHVSGPLDETGLTSNLQDGDVGRSWYANVSLKAGGTATTYESTAICSPASDATFRVDPFTVPGIQSGDGQAFCPPGSRVVVGGVTQSGGAAGASSVRVSGPLDETGLASNLTDGDVGRSWYANVAYFDLGGGTGTFVSTAICAPPTSTTAKEVQKCKGKKATIAARPGLLGRRFKGTPSRDVIVGTSKKDKISAGKGKDLVCAGNGNDTVQGGAGKDKLYGEGGRDKLLGQGGPDLLSGGGKRDTCVGGPGKDIEKSC
jgi:Ca2+-binding RTX toxin-like protein